MKNSIIQSENLRKKMRHSSFASLFGIICMIITFAILVQINNSVFLSKANILNILKQVVVYGLLLMKIFYKWKEWL